MAAPTNAAKREESSCQLGAVHTWHETDMPKSLGDVRCWVNSGKHLLALSFSGFDRLRENVCARKARRIVFSIVLSRQPSPALLFFKLIEVETKFRSQIQFRRFHATKTHSDLPRGGTAARQVAVGLGCVETPKLDLRTEVRLDVD